ncbi:MAG: hypothetical protein RM049_12715 [Nostoc sp. DedQUE04]|uniref:hypothetical protein n=1 Tax=unclassified Nostoc TaxID=2593658 RepID=UPI002AD4AAA4|nr:MULTISPECIES: hypothetical protein [unclassified Nostoc]MDZ8128667.1 hypothetical protein [Nostoc sp. DedQUE07]MDZ8136147.1 hypothetical protein [Nostoc sp. DedQUE04]
MLRHHQRRCTGCKVAPSSLVIRGSVKLACAIATSLHSFTASDLAQVDIHTWLELRSQLQKHHALPELNSIDFAEIPRLTWLI